MVAIKLKPHYFSKTSANALGIFPPPLDTAAHVPSFLDIESREE